MIMTEEEARKKWCPKSMVLIAGTSANRALSGDYSKDIYEATRCLAGKCAIWMPIMVGSDGKGRCGLENRGM
jgi:hypothetical protein